ncbi:MAG: DUF4345 domain-containing protein [Chrysiogenetes bacterium]|nr:DUF4345 domain-containing protein [Chrysiogenetes bacterium]
MEAVIWIVGAAFAGMGVVALARPQFIMDYFDVKLTADGRNEVRAVYGGMGLALGAALFWATQNHRYSAGIIMAMAIALGGMAAGRAISATMEKPGKWPTVFFVIELASAIALYLAIPKGAGFNLSF